MSMYLALYNQVSDCTTKIAVPVSEVPPAILRMGIWREHKKYENALREMGMSPKGKLIRTATVTLEEQTYTELWMEFERQIAFSIVPQESKK